MYELPDDVTAVLDELASMMGRGECRGFRWAW
jgi:hypothetical protein